ncbi:MFS transporter [Sphingobacterium sp.]|uniref:MFS transporter n=1 Tax=Sphingobacterium sp. TaxID=341027 RepID=UPI0028A016BB|nr:MFS transporter [Sphingobacterium sp.]
MEENKTIEQNIQPKWGAVYSIALSVAGLIIAEFLPASLLTPMASDLGVSEGTVGQAISVTAAVAMIASLFTALLTQRIDRRWVLISFSVLLMLSNLIVAYSPNLFILLIGRVLLGIGIGGCWGMMAATAMRLVPKNLVPKALSIIFGAVSVATVIAAPLGSFLGMHIGWRNVFLITAVIGVVAFIWQLRSLPSMPSGGASKLSSLFRIFDRPKIRPGMTATFFVFMSYAIFFSYLRPFLENITNVHGNTLTLVLLAFGIANFFGATFSRYPLQWNIHRSLVLAALFMGISVLGLMLFGELTLIAVVLVSLWGLFFGVVQVGWTDWLTRTVPDEAESAGGVQIAIIQLSITIGASAGGLTYDIAGTNGIFIFSTLCALAASFVAMLGFRTKVITLKPKPTTQCNDILMHRFDK